MLDATVNILVVDDSMFMRHIIKKHLHKMGFRNIIEAASGANALTLLREKTINLVISDWCMPGMHGIDLLRTIRADQSLHDTPFVMLTAEAQPHLIAEAQTARVSAYITKPFTYSGLQEELTRILEHSGKQKIDNQRQFI
ncbi:MAG: response regulator [Desulfobulbaceae bacterium]|nr:response regulator [Desulfobulbaceae bacterium]